MKLLEQTKRDFFAYASHELKTPITILKGYGELISNDMLDTKGLKEVALQISKQSDLMSLFVDDMLTLSRLEVPDEKTFEVIDISKVLGMVLNQLAPLIKEKKLDLIVDISDVKHAAENLIENGIKYNKPGGKLEVRLYEEMTKIIFEVYDEGLGIPKEEQVRVFERFYRIDGVRHIQGTGLGLAIVKHIVSNYRGTIELDSVENEYTKMKITL